MIKSCTESSKSKFYPKLPFDYQKGFKPYKKNKKNKIIIIPSTHSGGMAHVFMTHVVMAPIVAHLNGQKGSTLMVSRPKLQKHNRIKKGRK